MADAGFKDHFSGHANVYRQFRPTYDATVAAYCASLAPAHDVAWDAATGNGQLAVLLANTFDAVIATDASSKQIAEAEAHPRVTYRTEPAEQSTIALHSVSLITVAQAAHWLDHSQFAAEARRVAKPGAAIVYLAYDLFYDAAHPEFAELMRWYYQDIVGSYWPPERVAFDDGYRSIPFPFQEITPPALHLTAKWTREAVLGYVRSWSSSQRYLAQNGNDPVELLAPRLAAIWPSAGDRTTEARTLRWDLLVRAGHVR